MKPNAGGKSKTVKGLLGLVLLAACETTPVQTVPPVVPPARPAALAPVALPPQAPVQSEISRQLAIHYGRLERDLVARGLLRTDGGGPDAMFTDTILARNFVNVALFDEYVTTAQGLQATPTASRLRRWEQPVRFNVVFGDTVPADQRLEDTNSVTNFVSRLARVTGQPMTTQSRDPNFHVLILNEEDRLGFERQLRALVPGIDAASLRAFTDVPRDTLCLVLAFSENNSPDYSKAVALIRGEHPDLMRLACIHEELAQGLGLANDSPQARPSIFNDDEEFALLTNHDELLLKMLYDPRLQTGMTEEQAAPIARRIARELMNNGPS